MGAVSHEDQFVRKLKKFEHEKASFAELAVALGGAWTPEKVEAKARLFDEKDNIPISVVRRGVQYFGCETGTKPGLYKEVRRGIVRRWGPDNAMRNIDVRHTSRTSVKGAGTWTQPDLAARVIRKSTAKPTTVYLAIEVEQPGGFSIASVYQAYEFGRGADFSWVFYTGPACKPEKNGRIETKHKRDETKRKQIEAEYKRIETAAKELGVGIVHAAKPTAPAGWKIDLPARIRSHTKADQSDFLRRSGLTPESFDAE